MGRSFCTEPLSLRSGNNDVCLFPSPALSATQPIPTLRARFVSKVCFSSSSILSTSPAEDDLACKFLASTSTPSTDGLDTSDRRTGGAGCCAQPGRCEVPKPDWLFLDCMQNISRICPDLRYTFCFNYRMVLWSHGDRRGSRLSRTVGLAYVIFKTACL